MKYSHGFIALLASMVFLWGCDQKPPDRNQIPIIRARLLKIQEAVKAEDRAQIDSLLSVEILDYEQGSDSLLAYVYGPLVDYSFVQFEIRGIIYTDDIAKVDCFIMDSLRTQDRPILFTYKKDGSVWMLKKFEPGEMP